MNDADPRLDRLCASVVRAVSFWLHPVRGPLLLFTGALVALAVLEFAPGVPHGARPYARYKHARAGKFVEQARLARQEGDDRRARLALESALVLEPQLRTARIELIKLLVDERRFDEAAASAGALGMDGPGFVHDLLFYTARHDDLLLYSARQSLSAPQGGVWLQSTLLACQLASSRARDTLAGAVADLKQPQAALVRAILSATHGEATSADAHLQARVAMGKLPPEEIALGVEILIQAGDPALAWVWLQRHRHLMNEFDALWAEYLIASVRDPVWAGTLLENFRSIKMNDTRWARLLAATVASGSSRDAGRAVGLLNEALPRPSATLAVAAWALLMRYKHEQDATRWNDIYRRTAGIGAPTLAGRQLSDPDRLARANAVRLIAASTPLPREMIAALLLR